MQLFPSWKLQSLIRGINAPYNKQRKAEVSVPNDKTSLAVSYP